MTYDEIKKAALALGAAQQDGLLKALAAEHVKRKADDLAAKSSGWVQWAWRIVSLAVGIGGTLWLTSCTTAVKQSQTAEDGSVTTTERVFSLSASEARDLIKLYGYPQIPVVNVGK